MEMTIIDLESQEIQDAAYILGEEISRAEETKSPELIVKIRALWDDEDWEDILAKSKVEGSTWYVWWMDGVRKFILREREESQTEWDRLTSMSSEELFAELESIGCPPAEVRRWSTDLGRWCRLLASKNQVIEALETRLKRELDYQLELHDRLNTAEEAAWKLRELLHAAEQLASAEICLRGGNALQGPQPCGSCLVCKIKEGLPAPSEKRTSCLSITPMKTCVYLIDGTKVVLKREGEQAWLEVVPQATLRPA